MRTISKTILLLLMVILGCRQEQTEIVPNCSEPQRFLPLQIGNRWEENDSIYVEVVGTRRFAGSNEEYATIVHRLQFAPFFDTLYFRVNKREELLYYSKFSKTELLYAKLCTFEGERFGSTPDAASITTTKASADTLVFEHDEPVPCVGFGPCPTRIRQSTYVRDIGWLENPFTNRRFTEARINGRTIRL